MLNPVEPHFFDLAFFQALVTNVLGVFIGAAVGIPIGVWLDRRGRAATVAESLRAERQRQLDQFQQMLRGVQAAVAHNQELVRQINRDLAEGSGYDNIFYNLDPRGIDVLMPDLIAQTLDFDLVSKVNNFRYQLEHLARKVDSFYELEYGAAANVGAARIPRRDELVRSIREHAPNLLREGSELEVRLNTALQAGEAPARIGATV